MCGCISIKKSISENKSISDRIFKIYIKIQLVNLMTNWKNKNFLLYVIKTNRQNRFPANYQNSMMAGRRLYSVDWYVRIDTFDIWYKVFELIWKFSMCEIQVWIPLWKEFLLFHWNPENTNLFSFLWKSLKFARKFDDLSVFNEMTSMMLLWLIVKPRRELYNQVIFLFSLLPVMIKKVPYKNVTMSDISS